MPNLDTLPVQITDMLKAEATAYLKDNRDAVAALGEDLVRAILIDEVFRQAPQLIPPEIPDPTAEYLAEREEILNARDQAMQLVAKAQLEENERLEQVKKNAVNVAGRIAGALSGVLMGGLKVLITG